MLLAPEPRMDFKGFFSALFSGWVALMTIPSIIANFASLLLSKKWQKYLLFSAAVIVLFLACVKIWTDEHRARLALEAQPQVVFQYENTDKFIVPPSQRPEKDWVVWVKVVPDKKLEHPCLRVKEFKIPPSVDIQYPNPKLPSDQFEHAFECQDISDERRFALFFYNKSGDNKWPGLWMYVEPPYLSRGDEDTMPPDFERHMKNMKPGKYEITVSLEARNLRTSIQKTFVLQWYGDMNSFHMEKK